MITTEYTVTGMTCEHCERAVRDEVTLIDAVENVDVSASDGRLVVTARGPIADSAVLSAVDEAGYAARRA